ncbi:hypothetical protein [Actinomyces slackii]|uniref:hypothetical protein n=1 Tax=Actinomyces slackii TaxID=52774 RepID=UPI0003FB7C2B|nr:hypothetical protein [Actinomyces slackii]
MPAPTTPLLRVVAVMGCQNVHLTAHELFIPNQPRWQAPISPGRSRANTPAA